MTFPTPVVLNRTKGSTTTGTAFTRQAMIINGGGQENALVWVPDRVAPTMTTRFVCMSHGAAASRTFAESPRFASTLHEFLDRGWIVGAHDMGGDLWGNAQALSAAAATYDYVARRWWIDGTLALGFSMGGLATLNIGRRRELPDLAGVITVNGVVDAQHMSGHIGGILSAYGATDSDDLLTKQDGYDPIRDPVESWAGLDVLQVAGSGDSVCPPAEHAQPLESRIGAVTGVTTQIGDWGHLVESVPPAEIIAWSVARLDPFDEDQEPATHYPVPSWPGEAAARPIVSGGSLRTTGGVAVGLCSTDGRAWAVGVVPPP